MIEQIRENYFLAVKTLLVLAGGNMSAGDRVRTGRSIRQDATALGIIFRTFCGRRAVKGQSESLLSGGTDDSIFVLILVVWGKLLAIGNFTDV